MFCLFFKLLKKAIIVYLAKTLKQKFVDFYDKNYIFHGYATVTLHYVMRTVRYM